MEKSFDEIMKEINAGLTGDYQADLKYLEGKCREYKDHQMGKEVVRECGRIMFEILPEDKKAELSKALEQDKTAERAVLDGIRTLMAGKEYDKALKMLEEYEKQIASITFYENDEVSEYFRFDEFMQEVVYRFHYNPTKHLREATGVPYCEVYLLYGRVLTELKRFEEARKMLEKGLRWNPLGFELNMQMIETYKLEGDMDKAFELAIEAFKIAIHPVQVGFCYRNLGYIFVEKKLYPEAAACYIMGAQFDKNTKLVQDELDYIRQVTGETYNPTMADLEAYSKEYGFPVGADRDVVGLAVSYGKHFLEEKEFGGAKYCLGIAYALTDDEGIKELLDTIPEVKA